MEEEQIKHKIKNYSIKELSIKPCFQDASSVVVIVTSACIHLYFLSIVTRCLFWDFIMSCHAPMFQLGESIM